MKEIEQAIVCQPALISPEALLRAESVYRERLVQEPDDMSARTNLAWCLFMQTLHQSGRESVFASLAESGVEVTSECQAPGQSSRRSGASDLLGDCLRQLTAVTQLSRSRDDQRDVEKLRGLVRLAGGEEAVVEAQVEAVRILQEITRDIFHSGLSDGHPLH